MYTGFTLLYTRNYHNTVNQLYTPIKKTPKTVSHLSFNLIVLSAQALTEEQAGNAMRPEISKWLCFADPQI